MADLHPGQVLLRKAIPDTKARRAFVCESVTPHVVVSFKLLREHGCQIHVSLEEMHIIGDFLHNI